MSEPSAANPAFVDDTPSQDALDGDIEMAAPTIDAIIAEPEMLTFDTSLDKRFTTKQLEAMTALIPEYSTSLRKQKSHVTRGIADQFIKEILDTGETLTKAQRGRILAVSLHAPQHSPALIIGATGAERSVLV